MAADKIPPMGQVFKYKKLLFWAQGGTICIEDTGDETETRFRSIPLGEFIQRALALKQIVTKREYKYVDERLADEKFLEDAAKCGRQALNQGDPFDPSVLEHFYKHRRRSFICGLDGKPITLHTVGQGDAGGQGLVLPPIPVAPASKPFSPTVY